MNVTQYGGTPSNAVYLIQGNTTTGPFSVIKYFEDFAPSKHRIYIKPADGLRFIKAELGTVTGSGTSKITIDVQGSLADGSYYADITITSGMVTSTVDHVLPLIFTIEEIPYSPKPSTPSQYIFNIIFSK